jgi:hypothetical protein
VEYLAFYKENQILDSVPRVVDVFDQVDFAKGKHRGRLAKVIRAILASGRRREVARHKVFLLTSPDDPQTKWLSRPTPNDLRSQSVRRYALTRYQRYVNLDDLLKAGSTAEMA